MSRERLNQILSPTRLASEIQRMIMDLPEHDRWRLSERGLRRIARLNSDAAQVEAFHRLQSAPGAMGPTAAGGAGPRIRD